MAEDKQKGIWSVIAASSAGTLIEWYDFYIFGSLAPVMAEMFFPKGNPTLALLNTYGVFAAGFIVRPFGAFFFGRLGDLVGRKYTFLLTLAIMGLSTFVIGLLPTYQQVGFAAPLILILLRCLQGLALGGEYGGAATYVAEHAPDNKRGFFTSFIQTTATLGLFVSIGVIMLTKGAVGKEAFSDWGWRLPFLLSAVLVVLSYLVRKRMQESPMFAELKAAGKTSSNPLRDSFVNPSNRRLVLLALFGATAGQGVVWYTAQFYAMAFMQKTLKLEDGTVYPVMLLALGLATPLFVFFGALSDKIGRKKVILAGLVAGAVLFHPAFNFITSIAGFDGKASTASGLAAIAPLTAVVFVLVVCVTMAYGPIAAYLVELFPTRIRYTSMSVPYHIGNGVFGGLVPLISTASVEATKNIYAGLVYPIVVALITVVIGAMRLPETLGRVPDLEHSETELA